MAEVTHARDNKKVCKNLQGPVRLPGKSRMRLAGKLQPMALEGTNENTAIEYEGDTRATLTVEKRQVVSSLARSVLLETREQRGARSGWRLGFCCLPSWACRGQGNHSLDTVTGRLCKS